MSTRGALALLACLILALATLGWGTRAAEPADTPPALLMRIDGPIGPATADYVARGLALAEHRQAPLAILEIDTPGGLDRSMRAIIAAILASPVPVVCLVAPPGARAASAGTYILYGCPLAAMAPGTTVGAATPVALGPGRAPDDAANDPHAAKALNDAAAYIRGLASLHGRNAPWAEQAVRRAATLTAAEASRDNVVDFVAADVDDLLAKADGRRVMVNGQMVMLRTAHLAVQHLEPPWHSRFLSVITDPEVAYILLLIGLYGVIFELMAPGHVLPGVLGGVALLLAMYALALLPLNFAGVALLLLGVALMAAEPFVISHGVLGVGGAAAFAVGSVMMFGSAAAGFELPIWVVLGATLGSALVLVWSLGLILRARRGRHVSGAEVLLGSPAEVTDWSGTTGRIHIHGEEWLARATAKLQPGQRVTVIGRDGLTLEVEPDAKSEPAHKGGGG